MAGGKSRIEGSGPHHRMWCAPQPFEGGGEDLEKVVAEQSVPFVATEFTVPPGAQRLEKGDDRSIQVQMAEFQPEEFDQAPQFASWIVLVAGFCSCVTDKFTRPCVIAFLTVERGPGKAHLQAS